MGFGILFIGYFLCLPSFANFFITMVPGAVLLAIACRKLARVNIPFLRGFYVACALVPLALVSSILRFLPPVVWLAPYLESATLTVWLLWHLFTLTGIEWVAQETGLSKLRVKAFRNKVFICIYLLPAIALTLIEILRGSIPEGGRSIYIGLYIAILAVGAVVMLLNLLLIYTAYAYICMPEDLHMPRKPSRFDFINRRRAAEDKRDAENLAALEDAKARRQARIEAKRQDHTDNRQKNQKKHKKRK